MANTVNEYINSFPEEIQVKLKLLKNLINETAPEAQEKIAWGVPTYNQNGFLVQFAGYKNHLGFYTSPKTLAYFKEQLSNYKTNDKNTVQFFYQQELPLDLIKQMILFKIKENARCD